MNRRTWIAGITATTLLAASLAACKQEQQGEETGHRHGGFFPTH